ncbi:hypothetical protein NLG97_g8072 [Lecanicillium saksenae]|uniref:Uncharacterized protein n=1 Tax=Lecanicillium saksenae TaxID=468837 RepID=A0ACC1QLW9_9HYPO|nr:hypothetical protein NLG97_g8072 [Lecanicillium saksenae]
MVDYLYTGSYKVDLKDNEGNSAVPEAIFPLVFHSEMFMLADKYLVKNLKLLSEKHFRDAVSSMNDVGDLLSAVPKLYDLPTAVALPLQKVLNDTIKDRMASRPYAASAEESMTEISEHTPEFFVTFFRSLWKDAFPVKRPCASSNCAELSSVEIVK